MSITPTQIDGMFRELQDQRNQACARAASLAGEIAECRRQLADANKKIEALQPKPEPTPVSDK